MPSEPDTTRILERVSAGDQAAVDELLRILYDELHARASDLMRDERREHTLQATALVHEAYLRLVDQTRARWKNRGHFLAVAATVMRRILVDHARSRGRAKRGGERRRVPLTERTASLPREELDLAALDRALGRLEAFDPPRARIVELRYFGGLTVKQIAEVMDTPVRTVERGWSAGRAWLHRELTSDRAANAGAPIDE